METDRLAWLDALRGLALLAFALLAFGEDPSLLPGVLRGRTLGGEFALGLADLLLPTFLFVVGLSQAAAERRDARQPAGRLWRALRVARRTLALVALGLFLNAFPRFDLANLRLPGPLLTIALVDFDLRVIGRRLSTRAVSATAMLLAVGHGLLLHAVGAPGAAPSAEPGADLGAWLDGAVLGAAHLAVPATDGLRAWDPCGLLTLLPATAIAMTGLAFGRLLARPRPCSRRSARLAIGACLAFALGRALAIRLPIEPATWSSPALCLTLGWILAATALVHELFAVWRVWPLSRPVEVAGRNSILVYTGTLITVGLLQRIPWTLPDGGVQSLWQRFADFVWKSWAPAPVASVLLAASLWFVWWAIAWALHRRHTYLVL